MADDQLRSEMGAPGQQAHCNTFQPVYLGYITSAFKGRSANAIACLQPTYDRFTEGFGTADLIAAKQLLGELGDAGGH
jgi:hypothetical protein